MASDARIGQDRDLSDELAAAGTEAERGRIWGDHVKRHKADLDEDGETVRALVRSGDLDAVAAHVSTTAPQRAAARAAAIRAKSSGVRISR